MITQIKPGHKYVFICIAVINDQGVGQDPDSAEALIYKVSQVDGSLSSVGSETLVKQNGITGFFGKAVNVEAYDAGEYIVFIKAIVGTDEAITVETMSIDQSKSTIDEIKGDVDSAINTLNIIKEIQSGKWEIINNQMIIYESDNLTEIMRFNLFDADGTPAMENVFKREKV